MQRHEMFQPDRAIEFRKHLARRSLGREVVTGRENVRGIEANAEALRFAHVGDDVGDMLESIAKTRALAGGRFERDLRFRLRQDGVHRVD